MVLMTCVPPTRLNGRQDCGMIRDFDNPTVRLPESVADGDNLNPTDENVIETVSLDA